MTLLEQLQKVQATKSLKQTEIKELLTKSIGADETPNDEVEDKIKSLESEVETLEKNHSRISKLIADEAQVTEVLEPIKSKKEMTVEVTSNLDKGIGFAKYVRAKAASAIEAKKGNYVSAFDIAKSRGEPEQVLNFIKAGTIGSTTDTAFGSVLTDPTILESEFVELLRDNTVFDKLTSQMRQVDFNQRYLSQTKGTEAEWVGEAKVKPMVNPEFGSVQIKEHKLAAIVVVTDEMLRNSKPNSDKRILQDLIEGTASKIDKTFLDAVAQTDVRPEGILNGVTGLTGSGRTAEAFLADLAKLRGQFISNQLGTSGLVYVMSENMVDELAELRSPLGVLYFDGLQSANGDKYIGNVRVLTTNAVNDKIIAVKPSELLLADDGAVQVDYSDQATVGGVSLWENNLSAVRVERFISWAKARPVCTGFVDYKDVV